MRRDREMLPRWHQGVTTSANSGYSAQHAGKLITFINVHLTLRDAVANRPCAQLVQHRMGAIAAVLLMLNDLLLAKGNVPACAARGSLLRETSTSGFGCQRDHQHAVRRLNVSSSMFVLALFYLWSQYVCVSPFPFLNSGASNSSNKGGLPW